MKNQKQTNLIYFGSPDFSAEILTSILAKLKSVVTVTGVVTQPDKPQGRAQELTPSSVAITAGKYDLPVFKPDKLDSNNLDHLKLLKPDLFLIVSYKKLIPANWLETPKIGTFNLHFSLLPKYRGALCISEPIRNRDRFTGVTLMVMDPGLDTGPIISQLKIDIDINDNVETLTTKLTQAAVELLVQWLPVVITGKYTALPQDNSKAFLTPTTKSRDRKSAFIGWSEIGKAMHGEHAAEINALINSLNPDPGAWTKINDLELKLLQTRIDQDQGSLIIELVQIPGKNPITWKNFISGHPILGV